MIIGPGVDGSRDSGVVWEWCLPAERSRLTAQVSRLGERGGRVKLPKLISRWNTASNSSLAYDCRYNEHRGTDAELLCRQPTIADESVGKQVARRENSRQMLQIKAQLWSPGSTFGAKVLEDYVVVFNRKVKIVLCESEDDPLGRRDSCNDEHRCKGDNPL